MLQNARVAAFTVSELLRENQKGGGGKINPLHPASRLGLSFFFETKTKQNNNNKKNKSKFKVIQKNLN